MPYKVLIIILLTTNMTLRGQEPALVTQSYRFSIAAKTGQSTNEYIRYFKQISTTALIDGLPTDAAKKAFWLNLYNAYTIVLLKEDSSVYQKRNRFFRKKQITLGTITLSLNDIEHGILRRSKIWWSQGYLNKIFVKPFEKKCRVAKLDWRIHFALNCGAKSCPPVAAYTAAQINEQLEKATRNYLRTECRFEEKTNTLYLPKLFYWFQKDFGGKNKIKKIVHDRNIAPANSHYKIKYLAYDWRLSVFKD